MLSLHAQMLCFSLAEWQNILTNSAPFSTCPLWLPVLETATHVFLFYYWHKLIRKIPLIYVYSTQTYSYLESHSGGTLSAASISLQTPEMVCSPHCSVLGYSSSNHSVTTWQHNNTGVYITCARLHTSRFLRYSQYIALLSLRHRHCTCKTTVPLLTIKIRNDGRVKTVAESLSANL